MQKKLFQMWNTITIFLFNFKEELSFQFSTHITFTLNIMLGKVDLTGSIMSIIPNLISCIKSCGYQNTQKVKMFVLHVVCLGGKVNFSRLVSY